jgi:hypothetical protein
MKLLHDGKAVLAIINDNVGDPLLVSPDVVVFESDASAALRDEVARLNLANPAECAGFIAATDADRRAYSLLKSRKAIDAELATLTLSEKAASDVADIIAKKEG